MKKTGRITVAFGAVVLAAVVMVGGFSAMATGGGQEDPLVTLSYLTQVVTPQILEKVDEQVAANEQALLDKIDAAIGDYSEQMEQVLTQGTGKSSSFTLVEVGEGRQLVPGVGSELLLRSGNAVVSAGTAPVLLDSTSGSTVGVNGALAANHLYVVPLGDAVINVSSGAQFLIRGAYTIG